MTLPILLLLTALGGLCGYLRRRRLARTLLALALIGLLVAGCGLLPRLLLSRLQHGWPASFNHWGQRNVIIVLGSGVVRADHGQIEPGLFAHGRIARALMLYRNCKAAGAVCLVEVSGGDPEHLGQPIATVYARRLRAMGIPAADLMLETRSMSTWQNAQFSAPMLKTAHPDRIVLVTSAMHMWRAQWSFRHFGIDAAPVRAGYLRMQLGWLPQAGNLTRTDLALHEYLGMAQYRLRAALHGDAPAKTAPESTSEENASSSNQVTSNFLKAPK
jgi:uncharacterized SAM-binding protein YcdF (DUF218 family)